MVAEFAAVDRRGPRAAHRRVGRSARARRLEAASAACATDGAARPGRCCPPSRRRLCHEYAAGSPGARHRGSRHDRFDHRRPAGRGAVPPRSTCSTTWCAAGGRTSSEALASGKVNLVEGDLRDRDLVHDLTAASDLVFHQAAIRITQCAEEPRLALEVLVDGTFNVLEAPRSTTSTSWSLASSASVYGLAEQFPTDRAAPPPQQRHLLRRGQVLQRGHAAQLPRDVRPGLRRPALLQRLRPADGRPRPVHRGARPLDGADRRRPAAADLR